MAVASPSLSPSVPGPRLDAPPDMNALCKDLQQQVTPTAVTIVGSGLSAACGLPTMSRLATILLSEMNSLSSVSEKAQWQPIERNLRAGMDLESALNGIPEDSSLLAPIIRTVANAVTDGEQCAIDGACSRLDVLPFATYLKNITFSNKAPVVITSNYDRLIEYAAELSGWEIDTCFVGHFAAKFDPEKSRESFTRHFVDEKTASRRELRKHIILLKPHGSLDWYLRNGMPIRSAQPLAADRLMITPGGSKYRKGYESPFDKHRELANNAIDKATGYVAIGYGFNDDHLQTHLEKQIAGGKRCLMLTHALTPKAAKLLSACPTASALTFWEQEGEKGSMFARGAERYFIRGSTMWSLAGFAKEIFE